MKKIVFSTHNKHKIEEIKPLLGNYVDIFTLNDMGIYDDIAETGDTLERNAFLKAKFAFDQTGITSVADDTGLEVAALNGDPGVYSARYAGIGCSFKDNINKLLHELEGKTNREARFRTIICMIDNGKTFYFEGIVDGDILTHPTLGTEGFGYDPIFRPKGSPLSFAEMPPESKNLISHRGIATRKLIDFIRNNNLK